MTGTNKQLQEQASDLEKPTPGQLSPQPHLARRNPGLAWEGDVVRCR
jgi:hypothetical protein